MDLGDDFSNNKTFDFGMVFLHELQHNYFGLPDSPENDRVIVGSNAERPEMYRGTGLYKIPPKGPTVIRMNVYRTQMGLPIRMTYPVTESGGLLFNTITITTCTNKKGKIKTKTENNYFFINASNE